jgi:collagenase-like PrtC family protease
MESLEKADSKTLSQHKLGVARNCLRIACDFSENLLEYIKESNSEVVENDLPSRITAVYGSRRESADFRARPSYRVPEISRDDFQKYVKCLNDLGVTFNYTLNASAFDEESAKDHGGFTEEYVKFLIDSGVETVIVTLPEIACFIRKKFGDTINIEVSTIAAVKSVEELAEWKERFGISGVCGNIYTNRDIGLLKALANYSNDNDMALTLIVNEFCVIGGIRKSGSCASPCINRRFCYDMHSLDYEEGAKLQHIEDCVSSRSNPETWLKAPFIRPEDLPLYRSIGINNFKVTGRSSVDFLRKVVGAYLREF